MRTGCLLLGDLAEGEEELALIVRDAQEVHVAGGGKHSGFRFVRHGVSSRRSRRIVQCEGIIGRLAGRP